MVGQSCKRVVRGLVADLLFCSLSPRYIKAHSDATYDFSLGGPQRLQMDIQHPVLTLVLEVYGLSAKRRVMVRHRRRIRVIALQVLRDRLPYQVSGVYLRV